MLIMSHLECRAIDVHRKRCNCVCLQGPGLELRSCKAKRGLEFEVIVLQSEAEKGHGVFLAEV